MSGDLIGDAITVSKIVAAKVGAERTRGISHPCDAGRCHGDEIVHGLIRHWRWGEYGFCWMAPRGLPG
jgi:hypothetical protein